MRKRQDVPDLSARLKPLFQGLALSVAVAKIFCQLIFVDLVLV